MEDNKSLEKRRTNRHLQRKNRNSVEISPWFVVGGAALVLGATIFYKNWADLKRYIKIKRM